MAPAPYATGVARSDYVEEPVSRTYQYRKVMKPMLERKRRARINRCLDELKELMVTALQGEGENVSKLEKADILELTVRHLHGLRRQQQQTYPDRFRSGFVQCAREVSQYLSDAEGVGGRRLLQHLGDCIRQLDHHQQQEGGCTPPPSPATEMGPPPPPMWRPW